MEPKHSSPEFPLPTPESVHGRVTLETGSQTPESSPEYGTSAAPERAPEQAAQAQAGMASQPTPVTLPTPVVAPQSDLSQVSSTDDSPAIAGDDDLIEKEWVDKAKHIISSTRDDPARREKEVGRLQADYLKKRYGKELGAATE
jgi:hypothetical protein